MASNRNTDRNRRVARLASRQHGVVSRGQLRRLGLSDSAIKAAVAAGRLHRVWRCVYSVGPLPRGELGMLAAAVLACEGAFISHRSAAALHGLLDRGPALIDVIAPPERGRKIDGIRFHRVRPPRREEEARVEGIPCTTVSRTLVDLAGVVGGRTLRSAFERAAKERKLEIAAVEAAADPGRRGISSLRALVDEWRRAAPVSRKRRLKSPLEAKILPLVTRRGLPTPLANAAVQLANGQIEVDFLWPAQRFVLEADSRDFHATDLAFERDRWRDRELLRIGYSTLRVTSRQAETEAEAIVETIAACLSAPAASTATST